MNKSCTIKIKIESLIIPKSFSSFLFISWKSNDFKGNSNLYQGFNEKIEIDEIFTIYLDDYLTNPINLSINAKSSLGSIHSFGEISFLIPEKVLLNEEIFTSYIINNKFGDFIINCSLKGFNYIEEDNINSIFSIIGEISDLTRYSELIKSFEILPNKIKNKENFWNNKGFFYYLKKIKKSKFSIDTLNELTNYSKELEIKQNQVNLLVNFYNNLQNELIQPSFRFLTIENKVLSLNKLNKFKKKKIPYLGYLITTFLFNFFNEKIPNLNLSIDEIIIKSISMITSILSSIESNENLILYCLSSSIYIDQFLKTKLNNNNNFQIISSIINMSIQTSLSNYLIFISPQYDNKIFDSLEIFKFICKIRSQLYLFEIPNLLIEKITFLIYKIFDYNIVLNWINEEKILNFYFIYYFEQNLAYDWPYLKSLNLILNNPDKYLNNKNELNSSMRGLWFTLIYEKLINNNIKKYSKKKIKKNSEGSFIPKKNNFEEWSLENSFLEPLNNYCFDIIDNIEILE